MSTSPSLLILDYAAAVAAGSDPDALTAVRERLQAGPLPAELAVALLAEQVDGGRGPVRRIAGAGSVS